MAKKLDGLHPLAYMGVNSENPPVLVVDDRAPTVTDIQNFKLGALWLWPDPANVTNRVYMLLNKVGGNAAWVQITTSGGGGLNGLTADDLSSALADVNQKVRLKGGAGIITSITGASELTIDALDSEQWTNVTGTTVSMAVNNGYICSNAALTTATLPATAALGSEIEVTGTGAGGWKIAQNASQLIHYGSSTTTTGTGGSITSNANYYSMKLVCVVANTTWNALSSVGEFTVV